MGPVLLLAQLPYFSLSLAGVLLPHSRTLEIVSVIITLLVLLLQSVLNNMTVHAAFHALIARPVSLGESYSVGRDFLWRSLGLGILASVGVAIGFMLLIVPGVWLVAGLIATLPALVIEDLGVMACFKRSWQLTEGYRWKIIGIFLVIVGVVLVALFGFFIFGILLGTLKGVLPVVITVALVGAIQMLINVAAALFGCCLSVVLYEYLRATSQPAALEAS